MEEQSFAERFAGKVPVVYLAGVARKYLADAESLSEALRPLAGLTVRSSVFAQRNGSDWTPYAFFINTAQGLGLRVSGDAETKRAIHRGLPRLLDVKVSTLRGRDLTSVDFDALIVDDPVRRILQWLDNPDQYQSRAENDGEWAGFVSLVALSYHVDPAKDGPLAAGARLGDRDGPWAAVWARFTESPRSYPGVVDVLRRSKPDGVIPLHADSWPQDNDEAETSALTGIVSLAGRPTAQIRAGLAALDDEHAHRRQTVWADLGQTPAAHLVAQLTDLAEKTTAMAVGRSIEELAEQYHEQRMAGRRCLRPDPAVALSRAPFRFGGDSGRRGAVPALARGIYRCIPGSMVVGATDNCISSRSACRCTKWYVRRLRRWSPVRRRCCPYQVTGGARAGLESRLGIAGVPTVTSTCKPSVSPIADEFEPGPELAPRMRSGVAYSQDQLKRALEDGGWSFVPPDGIGDPSDRGWTEGGDIDTLGSQPGV